MLAHHFYYLIPIEHCMPRYVACTCLDGMLTFEESLRLSLEYRTISSPFLSVRGQALRWTLVSPTPLRDSLYTFPEYSGLGSGLAYAYALSFPRIHLVLRQGLLPEGPFMFSRGQSGS